MPTPMKKGVPKTLSLTATGQILTGVEGATRLLLTSVESTGTKEFFVEYGATVDGGSVPAHAVAFLVSALPLELVSAHMGRVALYGDTFDMVVVLG